MGNIRTQWKFSLNSSNTHNPIYYLEWWRHSLSCGWSISIHKTTFPQTFAVLWYYIYKYCTYVFIFFFLHFLDALKRRLIQKFTLGLHLSVDSSSKLWSFSKNSMAELKNFSSSVNVPWPNRFRPSPRKQFPSIVIACCVSMPASRLSRFLRLSQEVGHGLSRWTNRKRYSTV